MAEQRTDPRPSRLVYQWAENHDRPAVCVQDVVEADIMAPDEAHAELARLHESGEMGRVIIENTVLYYPLDSD
jgi:hypothetical protein